MNKTMHFLIPTVLFWGGFLLGNMLSSMRAEQAVRQEAVKNGCGYYEADLKTGEPRFRWREFPPRTVIMKRGGTFEEEP